MTWDDPARLEGTEPFQCRDGAGERPEGNGGRRAVAEQLTRVQNTVVGEPCDDVTRGASAAWAPHKLDAAIPGPARKCVVEHHREWADLESAPFGLYEELFVLVDASGDRKIPTSTRA